MSLQEIFWRPSAVTAVLVLLTLLFCRASASTPVIKVMSNVSSRVVLQCESAGWYPEPELLWLDGEGNLLSAGPTETLRGPDDLYTVSSRVTVEKRHSNNITCRVQQRNTNQSRETHVHVQEDFFEILSSSPSLIIGLAVSLALCIILLILSAVVLLRRKRKHMMKTNRRPEDQTGEDRETERLNTSSSSTRTKKQTSCLPITSRRKLLEEQQRREEAEKNLQDIKAKLSGNISQAQKDKQKMERLRNELDSTKQQLQQQKQAAKDLKKQLGDKNREQQKGDIILDEVDGHAPYICLRNTSSEDKLMTGWELKLQINNQKPIAYKFTNFTLKAGEGLTLHRFRETRSLYPDNTHLTWANMSRWNSRDNVKISLISNTGEEHRLM